jgi:multiple sugar transport system permease protein
MRRRNGVFSAFRWMLLILCIIGTIFPFYFAFINSFRPVRDIPDFSWQPKQLTLKNWTAAVSGAIVPRWLLNSVIVTFFISTLSLCTDTLAGYAFARIPFPGRKMLFSLVILCLAIPMVMLVLPLYVMLAKAHLLNTYTALIWPAASAMGTFMMRQSIVSLPISTEEAARMDGCSNFKILWHVILPSVRPALASTYIVLFMMHWNNFLYPLTVTSRMDMRTLPVGLYLLAPGGEGGTIPPQWGLLLVTMCILFVPVIAVFVVLQKYFTRGIALSGMK